MSKTKKATLLFLGDSLVEWGNWPDLLPEFTVINRGRAGEHVQELAVRLPAELETCDSPDHILIMTGTNNLLMDDHFFPALLTTMLPRLQGLCPGVPVTLHSILPMPLDWLPDSAIDAANRQLATAAESGGCSFLDLADYFRSRCGDRTSPCFLDDGVHLGSRGYRVWADAIRDHLHCNPSRG